MRRSDRIFNDVAFTFRLDGHVDPGLPCWTAQAQTFKRSLATFPDALFQVNLTEEGGRNHTATCAKTHPTTMMRSHLPI